MTYSEYILLDDDLPHTCSICGHPLTPVRPGKWHCYYCWYLFDTIPMDALPFQQPGSVGYALPDLRYAIYAGVVTAGALLAIGWLVRDAWRNHLLS